jgi:hypothetical protein
MSYIPTCEFCLQPIEAHATEIRIGNRFQHLGLVCDRCLHEELPKHEALLEENTHVCVLLGRERAMERAMGGEQ